MLNLTDVFDAVRIVNLPHRVDRKTEIGIQLGRLGLDWSSKGVHIFRAKQPADAGDFPSIGARGCFLSHLTILQEAVEKCNEKILIIEDDLDFCKDAVSRLDTVLRKLEETDWSVFYGGYENLNTSNGCRVSEDLLLVDADLPIQTTHMVAFRGSAIQAAKDYLEAMLARPPGSPDGGPMHVDGAYSWFRRDHPEMKTVAAVPPLGFQRSSKSDIDTSKWYDQAPVVSVLIALARNAKNWLLR
ncbi:MAG: glycosyltransferase family 25 protein [Alphaproteobacteria bacterium]|nr:glycosyltransferase family 25 protein [Alphaproteobacteria bacterium]MBU0864374.1 glycosyltransferase family 25 protein [Alphaproteobacteria bacterium]MBU1825617.1 glycosyltransferase family 25 protein [Alphaproteobacteria bacterium]